MVIRAELTWPNGRAVYGRAGGEEARGTPRAAGARLARVESPGDDRPKPRVWPVFALLPAALAAALVLSMVVLAIAYVATGARSKEAFMDALTASWAGTALALVPGQMVFLAAALCAALLSPRGLRARLALGSPSASFAACALLVLGTLGVQGLIQLASPLLGEPSENLRELTKLLTAGSGIEAVLVTLLASALPGLCEEFLFRGYAQTRLVERFGAVRAILACSAFFALTHLDPQHVVAVFPLGIWIGIIAWRTGSIWPAIVAHALNNAFAVVQVRLTPAEEVFEAPNEPWMLAVFAIALVAGAVGLALARHAPPRAPVALPAPLPPAPVPVTDTSAPPRVP